MWSDWLNRDSGAEERNDQLFAEGREGSCPHPTMVVARDAAAPNNEISNPEDFIYGNQHGLSCEPASCTAVDYEIKMCCKPEGKVLYSTYVQ